MTRFFSRHLMSVSREDILTKLISVDMDPTAQIPMLPVIYKVLISTYNRGLPVMDNRLLPVKYNRGLLAMYNRLLSVMYNRRPVMYNSRVLETVK